MASFFGVLFCSFVMLIAVSGHGVFSGPEEQLKECVATVETIPQYLKKDSVQKIAFTALNEACQHVFSGHKDMCDRTVKAALSELNSFATKLQPKKVCSANFTVQGLTTNPGPYQGAVCSAIVQFIHDQLEDYEATIVDTAVSSACKLISTVPFLQTICENSLRQQVQQWYDQLMDDITPEQICGADSNY